MAKLQRTNQQTWHDLVAHTQHQGGIEHIVAQRDRSGHGDDIPAEEAEFHAWCALRHAIAHGGNTACDLGRGAVQAGLSLDQLRVHEQRAVGRQHVVVGSHDADVQRFFGNHLELVVVRHTGKCVGHIGAAHALGTRLALCSGFKTFQIRGASWPAARANAVCDRADGGVEFHVFW